MQNLTRGPLPARVYWTRRLLVLGTAFALVFALAHVFGGSSDAKSNTPVARQAAARTTPAPTTQTSEALPTAPPTVKKGKGKPKKVKYTPPPPAEPTGTCADEDVAVTPAVHHPVAGGQVHFTIKLRTIESAACTWTVSPDSLTLKVTSGADDIWFSRECTRSIKKQDVVIRNTESTKVPVIWSGRRSDDTCSRLTDWAMPGWYHVAAAAYAGEPSDVQFHLDRPKTQVVTETVAPDPKGNKGNKDNKQGQKKKQKVD